MADRHAALDVLDDEKIHDPERGPRAYDESTQQTCSVSNEDEGGSETVNKPPGTAAAAPNMPSNGAVPATKTEEPEAGRTKFQTSVIMFALCSALFLAALDITIIATAIPTITEQFQSPSGYTWIGAAYLLTSSATVPNWGKFSDIWGRKPVLLVTVAIFFVGSLICALSVNIAMLIAGRAIQGIGSGGIITLCQICVSDLFSLRKRGLYYAMFGIVWAIASAIGPVLGGVFTSEVTWRWCFWVNLPISGLGFFLLLFFLKLHNPRTPLRNGLAAVDWLGSVLITGGTFMFLLGLEFGGVTYPWNSATTICLLVFGVFAVGLFVLAEKYFAKYPVIPLRIFKIRTNIAAFGVVFFHGAVYISGSYYLPLYFQAVLGVSSLLSGVYLLPFAISMSVLSVATAVSMKKTGKFLPAIIFGMVLLVVGFGLFIDLGAEANWAKVIVYQIIAGIGTGPNFQAPLIALQSSTAPRDIASVTGTFGFCRQLALAISVVIGGVVFQNAMDKQYPYLLSKLGPDIANQLSGGSAGANVGLVASLPAEQGAVARTAFAHGLREMYIMYTVFAGVGLLISPFVGQRHLSREHHEHKTGLQNLRRNNDESDGTPDAKPPTKESQ